MTDDGVQDYGDTVLFGSNYTVNENVISAGWEFVSLDCSASSAGTAYSVTGAVVTFVIDSDTDVLDCTYTNRERLGAIEISKTRKHAAAGPGDHLQADVDFTATGGDLPTGGQQVTTGADGTACLDGLALGSYTVTESVPPGYVADDATETVSVTAVSTCGDGARPRSALATRR